MTVDELRRIRGARSDYHLAQIEGVTKQAVSRWRQRGKVPSRYDGENDEITKRKDS